MRTTLDITGMHCGACADRLAKAFRRVPGVNDVQVTLAPPRAAIDSDSPLSLDELSTAAAQAGSYTIAPAPAAEPLAAGLPGPAPQTAGGRSFESAPVPPKAAGTADALAGDHHRADEQAQATSAERPSLYPLILIIAYIAGVCTLIALCDHVWSWHHFMNRFMAGFFLVFSFFKLLDLPGFASAYRSYDLPARAWRPWAYLYPFVELALGVAYLISWRPVATNAITLALMLVGSTGVLRALLRRDAIRCACLGTALNLPMTTVTLVEDLGMAAMAAGMLIKLVAAG